MSTIVKICVNCGPLFASEIYKNGHCKTCSKKSAINWHKKNPLKSKQNAINFRNKNVEKIRSYSNGYKQKYKLTYPEQYKESNRLGGIKYYAKNRSSIIKKTLILHKFQSDTLHPAYVLQKIKSRFKTDFVFPIDFINLYGALLALKREIKKYGK